MKLTRITTLRSYPVGRLGSRQFAHIRAIERAEQEGQRKEEEGEEEEEPQERQELRGR